MFSLLSPEEFSEYGKAKATEKEVSPVDIGENTINAMGMDAAINLIMLSHEQMLTILGFSKPDNSSKSSMHQKDDIGKVLMSGGLILHLSRLNNDKVIGRSTSRPKILSLFQMMEQMKLGKIEIKKGSRNCTLFVIDTDIEKKAKEDSLFREMLYSHGITLFSLSQSRSKPNRELVFPKKSIPLSESEMKENVNQAENNTSNVQSIEEHKLSQRQTHVELSNQDIKENVPPKTPKRNFFETFENEFMEQRKPSKLTRQDLSILADEFSDFNCNVLNDEIFDFVKVEIYNWSNISQIRITRRFYR